MQNLTTLFGADGAARYLELCASNYRQPAWEVLALNADGSTAMDLSAYLKSWTTGEMTDQFSQSVSGTFTFANPAGKFDRFGGGADASIIVKGRILQFRKGLVDPVNNTAYLLPAQYGKIINTERTYQAPGGGSNAGSDGTIVAVMADALKDAIKLKFTSNAYTNTEVNLIAQDILEHFGNFPSGRIALANVSHPYAFVQFPDYALADALKTLFDPLLMSIRADEAGNITTRPRLGTALAGFGTILGYPDQVAAPPSGAIDYTIPSGVLVQSLKPQEQDWDNVANQCKVLGQAVSSQQTLGAYQQLYALSNSTITATDQLQNQNQFSQSGGSGGGNTVVAANVWVQFEYSTNHDIGSPRTQILSRMNWIGDYDPSLVYKVGDAVSYMGNSYARQLVSPTGAADPANLPTNTTYWELIPISGPFESSFNIINETGQTCGFINLISVTDTFIVLQVQGRQFSSGGGVTVRHHGGFDYNYAIFGQPALSSNKTLTAYADYNVQTVTGEALTDPFSDHITYQAAHQPFAMSAPVTVHIDAGLGAGPVSAGTISADGTIITGQTNFSVDFERGRIVLADLSYIDWSEDDNASHTLRTGGLTETTARTFTTNLVQHAAPAAIYSTFVAQQSKYVFPGLVVGQGYDVRLSFADPSSTDVKQRLFSVYVNGVKTIQGLDIFNQVGEWAVYQTDLSGVQPDPGTGAITILFTQYDPFTGQLLSECSSTGSATSGHAVNDPIINAIEILLPQGQGASPYAVNCGGPAINPTPPTVTCDYGYSPAQVEYGIQTTTIDDPLIADQASCQTVAQYNVNYSQWSCFRDTITCASFPHLQPGDLIVYTNPILNGGAGVTFYVYIQSIVRMMSAGSGSSGGGVDQDVYKIYVLYAE